MNIRQLVSTPKALRWVMNCYPPYVGAGIRVRRISSDYRQIDVEMKLRWYNKNYVGTQFGGSLFSMTDPFYMLSLMNVLGKDYIVWDKGADIDFIKPGKGTVTASFNVTDEMLIEIRNATRDGSKFLPTYPVQLKDQTGNTIAQVSKRLYIRKKAKKVSSNI